MVQPKKQKIKLSVFEECCFGCSYSMNMDILMYVQVRSDIINDKRECAHFTQFFKFMYISS